MLFIIVTLKVVMDITGGRYATTALAVAGTCKSIGSVALTWVAGLIIDAAGLQVAFLTLTGAAAVALLCAALIRLPKGENAYFSGEQGRR